MSHYGSPPDPDNEHSDHQQGAGDEETRPYSPYPESWSSTPPPPPPPPVNPSGQGEPYAQPNPYGPPSPYGAQNPYGQQGPYGQVPPPAPGGPVNPYAGRAADKPTFGFAGYAGWLTRAGGWLIDQLLAIVAGLPAWVGYGIYFSHHTTTTDALGRQQIHFQHTAASELLTVVGGLTSLAFFVWNVCIRQGRTGATVGKSVLSIRLVNSDLQPIGPGWCFLRSLLHFLDELPCACIPLGFLWPIWDQRKQTFADKIMKSFVINATQPPPPAYPPAPPQGY